MGIFWRRMILLASIAIISCAGLSLVVRWFDPFNARQLDPNAWATADRDERAAMARDAIRHLPPGTAEAEIKALLGEPNRVETERKLSASDPPNAVKTYSYNLGNWPLAAYDDTFLWVYVDNDGRVIKAAIGGG